MSVRLLVRDTMKRIISHSPRTAKRHSPVCKFEYVTHSISILSLNTIFFSRSCFHFSSNVGSSEGSVDGNCVSGSDVDSDSILLENILSSKALARRVKIMSSKHKEIMSNLHSSSSSSLPSGKANTMELSQLAPVAVLHSRFESLTSEIYSIQELLTEATDLNDEGMKVECREEIENIHKKLKVLGEAMAEASLPREEDDFNADAVLELRAGTGGDEACLFANELIAAYEISAKQRGWSFEILSQTRTDLGGIKEAAVSISCSGGGGYGSMPYDEDAGTNSEALGPYGYFKFESGVHRVQRVPINDVRIHTSAVSIAVLPTPNDKVSDSTSAPLLPANELNIETMRASGAGGQHVNTTDSAVRITHVPTGITATIQDERSQHKNKAKAMKLISARVRDKVKAEEARQRGEVRNSLMGGGDRSERIRTYNFPQDRVTDHRCKQSEHGIEKLLGGGTDLGLVGTFEPSLRRMRKDELLKELEEREEERLKSISSVSESSDRKNKKI